MAVGGDHFPATLKLQVPLPLYLGCRFTLREGGKTVGGGVISKILPDEPGDVANMPKKKATTGTSTAGSKKK